MTENTTVWVTEHDDANVQYVVNEREDMLGNYEDLIEERAFVGSFQDYLDTWVELEMPTAVFAGDEDARVRWIDTALGVDIDSEGAIRDRLWDEV